MVMNLIVLYMLYMVRMYKVYDIVWELGDTFMYVCIELYIDHYMLHMA